MKIVFALATILLIHCSSLNAAELDPCESGGAIGQGECATIALKKYDKELNKVYQEFIKSLPPDSPDDYPKKNLINAQREWISFRDKECSLQAELGGGVRMWRSSHYVSCLGDLTKKRTNELKSYMACIKKVLGSSCLYED